MNTYFALGFMMVISVWHLVNGGFDMNWATILTSVVVAAVVTAIIGIIKTLLDNRSKSNDSVRLFRYTKLYEIFSEYLKADTEIREAASNPPETPYIILTAKYRMNILNSYDLSKALVDKEFWGNIESEFDDASKSYLLARKDYFDYLDETLQKAEIEAEGKNWSDSAEINLQSLKLTYRESEIKFAESVLSLKKKFKSAIEQQMGTLLKVN